MDPLTLLGLGGTAVSLVGSLLKNDDGQKGYVDPYKGQRVAAAQDLMSGRQGQQIANVASAESGRMAQLAFEGFKNDPNLAGNAAARMGAYNSTQRAGQDTMVKAQVQGSQIDQENKARGAQMLAEERAFDYNNYLEQQKAAQNPSFIEQLGQSAIGSIVGSAAGAAGQGLGRAVSKGLFGIDPSIKPEGSTAATPSTTPSAPATTPSSSPTLPGGAALPDMGIAGMPNVNWQAVMRAMSMY